MSSDNTATIMQQAEKIIESKGGQRALRKLHRKDLLPYLFTILGERYSLDDYPQFGVLFGDRYYPQELYMCGRQIGKSSNFARGELLDAMQLNNFKQLYVAPLQAQTHYYSSAYLKDAINNCFVAKHLQSSKSNQSAGPVMQQIGHQGFTNGSSIKLTYAKTSSDRARGIYADRIDFDEIQDHVVDNIDVISQSLSQSNWGIRRFAGTAKTTDNTIEYLFQKSSRSEWVVKCAGCGKWNIPNMEGGVWKMIRAKGPSCVKCGKTLPVREGLWVAADREKANTFPGYHIPQIMVPAIAENPKKWTELVRKSLDQPPATTFQEILGISCSTGARILTEADIRDKSVLPALAELDKTKDQYVYKVGGIDWGVAEQTSFTVHTIVGVKPGGTIHTLYAKRFVGFDPDTVLKEITQAHRYYDCDMLGADYGMGFDKNVMLATRFSLPVIQIAYTSQNQLISHRPTLGYSRYMVDKVTALDYLFWAIKYGKILFPPFEEFKSYTQDLLSPFEQISEVQGIKRRQYIRNPAIPDDFCNALCYAYLSAILLSGSSMLEGIPESALGQAEANIPRKPEPDHLDADAIRTTIS